MTGVRWGYFDSSVLLKRYVPEPFRADAQRLAREHAVVASAVLPVELMSGLVRRWSGGDLTESDFRRALAQIRQDRQGWQLLEVTSMVLARAEIVVERTALRTLDAIHVASCLSFAETIERSVPFVTADARQRAAAERLALDVVWVA